MNVIDGAVFVEAKNITVLVLYVARNLQHGFRRRLRAQMNAVTKTKGNVIKGANAPGNTQANRITINGFADAMALMKHIKHILKCKSLKKKNGSKRRKQARKQIAELGHALFAENLSKRITHLKKRVVLNAVRNYLMHESNAAYQKNK